MEFDDLEALHRNSAAWRLLRADNAPMILSFLASVFLDTNTGAVAAPEITGRLDDTLAVLNERHPVARYPRTAKEYLDEWSKPEVGWLRRYYPPGSDVVHFDATPAVVKALGWASSLVAQPFVGTESRLYIAVDLLRQMAFGAEEDAEARLGELYRRRSEIDAEIARVQSGDIAVMDPAAQRDRYQQFSTTARGLLVDFREVEANFRALDRQLRERVALWDGSKGALLDEVLGDRSSIADSDEGRSFHAFYDFLLSERRQREFAELLAAVQALPAIAETDPRMRRVHYDWLDAAARTQATVRQLSEQLRRFLDDQVWLENRRVMDILRSIETHALRLRGRSDVDIVTAIDGVVPAIALPMERPLYRLRAKAALDSTPTGTGGADVDVSALFEQVYVDPAPLREHVVRALARRSQVMLGDLLAERPVERGLAELVAYLSLHGPEFEIVFDEAYQEHVEWVDEGGVRRLATLPRVTFLRSAELAAR
ncbi:hypothetical protein F4553_001930 [Allocatelliglobosispora scoriae]|uniref:DUF3375 domain-containing protein n=1 Tax=Allocatelliglobosispora scoriae TaxID=643052 RepID=A0A841BNZ5_9ACTN|nr:DUF3375 domain-containing protein [Allocatelliglobosispora scoriae]MBB5868551.1 hypothetical protein [Allocatelliglobosispora scoriae]